MLFALQRWLTLWWPAERCAFTPCHVPSCQKKVAVATCANVCVCVQTFARQMFPKCGDVMALHEFIAQIAILSFLFLFVAGQQTRCLQLPTPASHPAWPWQASCSWPDSGDHSSKHASNSGVLLAFGMKPTQSQKRDVRNQRMRSLSGSHFQDV